MHSAVRIVVLIALAGALEGCIVRTAADIVTAPVRIAGGAVDLVTTSQSEADEKRGRALRQREERLGRLERLYWPQLRDCRQGDQGACRNARRTYAEIETLLPTIPVPPGG